MSGFQLSRLPGLRGFGDAGRYQRIRSLQIDLDWSMDFQIYLASGPLHEKTHELAHGNTRKLLRSVVASCASMNNT